MKKAHLLCTWLVSGLLLAGCVARYNLPCLYTPAEDVDPSMFLQNHQGCARLVSTGQPRIAPRHLAAAHCDDGLAGLLIGMWSEERGSSHASRAGCYH